jgi:hypothetical protein
MDIWTSVLENSCKKSNWTSEASYIGLPLGEMVKIYTKCVDV